MYNILLIEDSTEDIEAFKDTIRRLNDTRDEKYKLCVATNYEEGINKLSSDFNGVVVDIRLNGGMDGNELIKKIIERYRVPVAVFTGTPDTEIEDGSPIKIYKKGEASHEEILNDLCLSSDTGLFNVLGGTGILEKTMTKIFWDNLYPNIDIWKEKKSKGVEIEKILLRYAIAHIQELIDNEVPQYITEEMYIKLTSCSDIKTGAVYKSRNEALFCIVLSPPCDLSKHNGVIKTDRILVCEIDEHDSIVEIIINQTNKRKKQEKYIQELIKNNYTAYLHWLPRNAFFNGGYINFRKIKTYQLEDFENEYIFAQVKVQEYFVKNILNRFSAYYARQGQPDFNFDAEAKDIVDKLI